MDHGEDLGELRSLVKERGRLTVEAAAQELGFDEAYVEELADALPEVRTEADLVEQVEAMLRGTSLDQPLLVWDP